MNITIRKVNPKIWKRLKVEAVEEGITIGQAINIALSEWLNEDSQKKSDKRTKSFWDINPFEYKGKDTGQLSMKVDESLYGWKK